MQLLKAHDRWLVRQAYAADQATWSRNPTAFESHSHFRQDFLRRYPDAEEHLPTSLRETPKAAKKAPATPLPTKQSGAKPWEELEGKRSSRVDDRKRTVYQSYNQHYAKKKQLQSAEAPKAVQTRSMQATHKAAASSMGSYCKATQSSRARFEMAGGKPADWSNGLRGNVRCGRMSAGASRPVSGVSKHQRASSPAKSSASTTS